MKIIKTLSRKKNSVVKLIELSDRSNAIIKYYPLYSRSMFIEMNIMATSRHQNVIQTEKLVLIKKNNVNTIAMLMEKLDENFMDIIQKSSITRTNRICYLLQIAYGIRYLHSNGILHLDLKSDNIMVTKNNCKIIDFGSSEYLLTGKILTNQTKCTVTHRAPEGFTYIYDGISTIDNTFDIWSFGIIILETLTGIPIYLNPAFPSYTTNYPNIYDVKMYEFITSDNFKKYVEKTLPMEIVSCLKIDSSQRPTINEIICYLTGQLLTITTDGVFKFDNGLTLVDDSIVKTKLDYSSLVYYQEIKQSLGHQFPSKFIWYTECLIDRICYYVKGNKINKKYIDQSIMLCLQFYNYLNDQSFANNFYNKEILDDIIMMTNGIFFHYASYV
jgi:serine/threonine protein kinase